MPNFRTQAFHQSESATVWSSELSLICAAVGFITPVGSDGCRTSWHEAQNACIHRSAPLNRESSSTRNAPLMWFNTNHRGSFPATSTPSVLMIAGENVFA